MHLHFGATPQPLHGIPFPLRCQGHLHPHCGRNPHTGQLGIAALISAFAFCRAVYAFCRAADASLPGLSAPASAQPALLATLRGPSATAPLTPASAQPAIFQWHRQRR